VIHVEATWRLAAKLAVAQFGRSAILAIPPSTSRGRRWARFRASRSYHRNEMACGTAAKVQLELRAQGETSTPRDAEASTPENVRRSANANALSDSIER
jgi:hypothetical protein